jgi:indolepyruvate ferredoxin oxidoreductase alpha subunit
MRRAAAAGRGPQRGAAPRGRRPDPQRAGHPGPAGAGPSAGFCTGCPERPIFTAMKLVERELGPHHVSAATSAATCSPSCRRSTSAPRPWATASAGPARRRFNTSETAQAHHQRDGRRRLLAQRPDQRRRQRRVQQDRQRAVVVDNSYTAATGGQDVLSSRGRQPDPQHRHAIEKAVRGVGVKWVGRSRTPTAWRRCATRCARR